MSTLTIGVGQQYTTLASAITASHDGDVLKVRAGTYTNDFAEITHKITIEGVGGMAKLVATTAIPNGKAILVTDTDVTLDHIEFAGATVRDGNGAGIRYQGGNLTITILSASDPNGTITIKDSEFDHNGSGTGKTHNIYVGGIKSLTIDNSYIHDAVVGHEVKSRAENTTITNSRIIDGPNGTASYSVDLPNGGNGIIKNNIIDQGPHTQNPGTIAFGEEGDIYGAGSKLTVTGNTILNDRAQSSVSAVWNALGTVSAVVDGNTTYGLSAAQVLVGKGAVTNNEALTTERGYSTASPIGANNPAPVTTPPVNTPPVTTPPVTTPPVTTPPLTTPPVTTPPVTKPPVTVPVTTPPVTTPPVTTPPVTTPTPTPTTTTTINLTRDYYGEVSHAAITEASTAGIWVGVHGSSNVITLAGQDVSLGVVGDNNVLKLTSATGRHILLFSGSGNVVDAGGGVDTIKEYGTNNTIVLHAGKGHEELVGKVLTNGDVLDVRAALATTNWNGAASTVGSYIKTAQSNGGHDTELLLSTTAGGAGASFATIRDTGVVSTATVLQHLKVS